MTFLPGWDSLDSVRSAAHWLHIAAIVVLGLLFLAEGLALVYDSRKDALVAAAESAAADRQRQQQQQAEEQHRAELAEVQRRLDEAQREKAPRDFTDQQQTSIMHKLSFFSGQPFTIRSYNDDAEAVALRDKIRNTLIAAKWSYEPTSHIMGFYLVVGVLIQYAPSQAAKFAPAANALASALTDVGIGARAEVAPGYETSAGVIHISVGKKR
jgi:hypothetical protein